MASPDFERKTLALLKSYKDDLFDVKVQTLIDRTLLELIVMTMATNGSLDARFFETARHIKPTIIDRDHAKVTKLIQQRIDGLEASVHRLQAGAKPPGDLGGKG